jgi:hypothetical protein
MDIFDEKCKCGEEMHILHEDGRNTYGTSYVYWCPQCGSTFQWYSNDPVEAGTWKHPVIATPELSEILDNSATINAERAETRSLRKRMIELMDENQELKKLANLNT